MSELFPKVPLGEMFQLEYGASLPERERSGVGYPVFGSNGIVGWHNKFLIQGPGIVVGRKGSVGEVCWSDDSFWPIDTAYYLVPKAGSDRRWLFWVLKGTDLKSLDAATGVPGLNRNDVYTLSVCAPTPDQQSRIAAVLDTVDEAIAKTEAVIAKLKQVRAGLLHDLLTRGLDEHGQLRDPVIHPEEFQDSPLGRFPREWSIETLGERLKQNSGTIQTGPFGSQLHAHEYRAEGVPVIMPQDIRGGDFDDTQIARISLAKAEELGRHRVMRGDLVFARRGDFSRCTAVGEKEVGWLCGTGCLLMHLEQLNLLPRWLSLAYRHDFGQRQIAARAVGTTMANLNTTLLAHLVLAFPRKQEQENIVKRIDEADFTIQKELANILKVGLLKFGLMNDLITGRVRVPKSLLDGV